MHPTPISRLPQPLRVTETTLSIERSALAAAYRTQTGQPLRRTGVSAALATLACRQVLAQEAALSLIARPNSALESAPQAATDSPAAKTSAEPLPDTSPTPAPEPVLRTLLLWHARAVVAEETLALLEALIGRDEPVMPFEFLASQPALLGLAVQPHVPGLCNAVCLPWVREDGGAIHARVRQLALDALGAEGAGDAPPMGAQSQAIARVIVLELDRRGTQLHAHAQSLRRASVESGA